MTVTKLRKFIYTLIKTYFAGANVVWGSVHNEVKPNLPLVVLQMGDIIRSRDGIMTEDLARHYFCRVFLDVNLYTPGKKVQITEGEGQAAVTYTYYENTALDDLSDFVNFLVSPYAQDQFRENNVGLSIESAMRDLTQVIDNEFEYRSMQEIWLSWYEDTAGYAGISDANWSQTASGGGTAELATQTDNEIDEVEFEQVDPDEEDDDENAGDESGDNENEGE